MCAAAIEDEAKISAEQLGKISFIDIQEPKKNYSKRGRNGKQSRISSESIISKFFSLSWPWSSKSRIDFLGKTF